MEFQKRKQRYPSNPSSKITNSRMRNLLAPILKSHFKKSLFILLFLLLFILMLPLFFSLSATATTTAEVVRNIGTSINISVPDTARFNPQEEEYVCTVKQINLSEKAVYLDEFVYLFSKNGSAHHFLLYGCKSVAKYAHDNQYWPCNARGKGSICSGRKHIPLGIPKTGSKLGTNAPTKFPDNVAYGVGPEFEVNYLMLEVHFMPVKVDNNGDSGGNRSRSNPNFQSESASINNVQPNYASGVLIHSSTTRPKHFAGMMVMAGVGFKIPHGQKDFSVDINCQPELSQPIFPYAYWVHTHDLGKVVSGYRINRSNGKFTEFARWSHRRPQPVILESEVSKFTILPGETLAGKCVYDSSNATVDIHWGPRHGSDEMCNLFLFYFTLSSNPHDLSISCVNERFKGISKRFPPEAYSLPEIVV